MATTSTETLTLRVIMLSQDAGIMIGENGCNIRRYRDESGAFINVSGGASMDRLLTVKGTIEQIATAFFLIATGFHDLGRSSGTQSLPPVTFRLLVPNSQCGPLIGKGGERVKAIRDASGVTITIPSETLPGSSERAVTVSGTPEAIKTCMQGVCDIFIEFPARQNNVQYFPGALAPGPSGCP